MSVERRWGFCLTLRTWFSVALWEGEEEKARMGAGVVEADGRRKADRTTALVAGVDARRREGISTCRSIGIDMVVDGGALL